MSTPQSTQTTEMDQLPDAQKSEEQTTATDVEASKANQHHGGFHPHFPDGGLRAWSVVLGAAIVLGCSFGYLSAFGVYQTYYEQHQLRDKTPSDIAWIGSIQIFFQFLCGLFSGSLFDMYGARRIMAPASIVYVIAIMMTSLCKEYYQFILAQGVLGGIGVGFLFTPAISAINHYFHHKRGIALGLAAGGSSIGGVLFPIALKNALYSHLGFGWGVRAIAFVVLAMLAIACALTEGRLPKRRGTMFIPRAFLQPSYSIFIAGVFFAMWGMWVPFFYLASFSIEKGHFGDDLAFYVLAIMNAASLFGRIIPGIIADHFGRLNMFVVICLVTGVLVFSWIKATSHPGLIVWTVFFGFFSGAVISLFSAGFAQITPNPREIGTWMGQAMAIISIAGLTGSPIAGAILDSYGWGAVTIFGGVSLLTGGALSAVARFTHNNDLRAKI